MYVHIYDMSFSQIELKAGQDRESGHFAELHRQLLQPVVGHLQFLLRGGEGGEIDRASKNI